MSGTDVLLVLFLGFLARQAPPGAGPARKGVPNTAGSSSPSRRGASKEEEEEEGSGNAKAPAARAESTASEGNLLLLLRLEGNGMIGMNLHPIPGSRPTFDGPHSSFNFIGSR